MKILVTGGNGLLGRAIQSIDTKNFEMIYIDSKTCDLRDYESTLQVLKKIQPDYIIHLAANVGGLYKNMTQSVSMLEDNVLINLNVLKCAHQCDVQNIVSVLSTCIFPDKTTYPINETMLHNGPPHYSNEEYAYAKRLLEIQCKAYKKQYNRNYFCVIPTNIYGKHDNFSLLDGHVIPALIHKAYLAKQENKPLIISGSGTSLRQFIYSEDLAKLLLKLVTESKHNDTIILSVSEKEEISIEKVAQIICNYFNMSYTFDVSQSDGQYKKTADNTLLRKKYPEFTFIDIEQGIKLTIDWFIQNFNIVRK